MEQTELKQALQADPELDAALEHMAEEVPPMPADFHEKWMNAVRAEAENAASAREEAAGKSTASLIRWTRILSVAAAFIFLIGGTVLYRNSRKSLNAALRMEEKAAATEIPEMAEAAAAGEEPEPGEESLDGAATAAGEMPVGNTVMAGFAAEEDTGEGEDMPDTGSMVFSNALQSAGAAAPKAASGNTALFAAEESDVAYEAAMEEDEAEAYEEAADFTAMEIPAETPSVTAAPTMLQKDLTAAPASVPEEAPEGGFLQDAAAFMTDMGDFLLAALPYLAVLAVPAAAALAVRRKKRHTAG